MSHGSLEPHELFEPEDATPERHRPLAVRVAVTAAILAMFASVAALEAEHAASQSLLRKNDAVLWQSRAADEWAYRQAKAIKLHLDEALSRASAGDLEQRRAEIRASEERARADEAASEAATREATALFEQHHRFALATSLFQIAIVLATVAAVVEQPLLWGGGIAVGAVGVLLLLDVLLRRG